MKENGNGNKVTNVSAASSVTNDELFVDDLPSAQNALRLDFIESPAAQKRDRMIVVGKQVAHDSAVGHVTGDALFVDDLPFTKNELVVDFIGSPVAHGEIININSEELAQLDGITGVFTHADIPGHNLYGPVIKDERFLAEDIVEYVGQPIAIITGESRRAIRQAKKRTLLEIQELTPVFTIDEAIKAKQFIGVPRTFKQGNFDKAWRESEHKITGTFGMAIGLIGALMVLSSIVISPPTPEQPDDKSKKYCAYCIAEIDKNEKIAYVTQTTLCEHS